MKKINAAVCLIAPLAAANACANPETTEPEVIVVTAERIPVLEKESARYVVVATGEELKETGGNNVIDGLRRLGGLSYKSLAPLGVSRGGMNSEISIRGLEDGELILINGVPIQSASGGAYDLSAFGLDNVERVEILTGAASTLYGADAMAGVINIITKDVSSAQSRAAVELGGNGFQKVSAGVALGNVQFGMNYQHIDAVDKIYEKLSKRSPYIRSMDDTDRYDFYLSGQINDSLSFNYLGGVVETGWAKHYLEPSTRASVYDKQHQIRHYLNGRYQKNNLNVTGFVSWDKLSNSEVKPKQTDKTRYNYNLGLSGDYHMDLATAELTLGSELIRRIADYTYSYGRHYRDDLAIFGQYKRPLTDNLVVSAGAREQFIQGHDGASDYSRFLPSAGLTYKATAKMNLFANVGKAFRAPSFNDLYYESATRVGNPDLDPEEGWTYEVGTKYDNGWISLRLVAFVMRYEDKIESYEVNDDLNSYYNAGNYENDGVEWNIQLTPFHSMDSYLNRFAFVMSGFVADPQADNEEGVSEQSGPGLQTKFGINYLGDDLNANLDLINTSDREDDLPSQLLVNFYSSYDLPKGRLTFAVDNLLDDEVVTGGSATSRYYDLDRMVKLGYEIAF